MLNLYDTTLYTEPDGTKWWKIFHHNAPSNSGLFSKTDTFSTGVYYNEDKWFQGNLVRAYDAKEYVVRVQASSTDPIYTARLTQTVNFMDAVFNNVSPSSGNVVYNQDSSVYSVPTQTDNTGGFWLRNDGNYIGKARGSSSHWGGFASFDYYNGGVPAPYIDDNQSTTNCKTGFIDVYMKVPTSGFIVAGEPISYVESNGGTVTFTVSSETAWTAQVTSGSGFITLDVQSGSSGVTLVTATLTANQLAKRVGEIVFSDGTSTETAKIAQKSPFKYWNQVQYIETDGTQRITTDYIPNNDSEIEYKMRRSNAAITLSGWDNYFGQHDNNVRQNCSNPQTKCLFIRDYNKYSDGLSVAFGSYETDNVPCTGWRTETTDDHIFTIDKTGITLDGTTLQTWDSTCFPNTQPLMFGASWNTEFRSAAQRIYYLTSTENSDVAASFKPIIDESGVPCILNETTGVRSYPEWKSGYDGTTNPLKAGSITKGFTADRKSMPFEPAGGEYELELTATNTWNCIAPTGYTISPMSGNAGTTTVTVTAAPNATAEKIKGVSTFYDADGYAFDLKLSTKTAGGHSELYMGAINSDDIRFGNLEVSKIMMGSIEVYGSGAFSGLKVSPSTLKFNNRLTPATLNVKCSESWTLTCDADWLSFSKNSGTAGKFQITVTPTSETQTDRTATITVTSANYSATCSVTHLAQHDYILETDGQCYFETNFTIPRGSRVEIENMRFILDGGSPWHSFIACQNMHMRFTSSGNNSWKVQTGLSTIATEGQGNGTYNNKSVLLSDLTTISETEMTYSYEGTVTTKSYSVQYDTRTDPIWIFSGEGHGGDLQSAGGRVGNITIYDIATGDVLAEFRPDYDDNDVVCFHETVSDTFYYNLGTGTPTLTEDE